MTEEELYYPYKKLPADDILFSFSELPEIKGKMCCPTCKIPLDVISVGFYFRRYGSFSGLTCKKCNSLWENPKDSWSCKMTGVSPEKLEAARA